MRGKIHKYILLVLWLALFIANATAGAHIGSCFSDVEDFRRALFGGDGALNDENIEWHSQGRWIWIVDKTPENNHDWSLLERSGAQMCYRAQINGSLVELKEEKGRWLITAVVSAIGLLDAKRGIYQMNKNGEYFILSRCERISGAGTVRRFPCHNWSN